MTLVTHTLYMTLRHLRELWRQPWFVAVTLVMVSGLAISESALPRLGIVVPRAPYWRLVHTWSANAILVLAGIHVGLNWRWVTNSVRQLVRRHRPAGRASVQGALS